MFAGLVPERGFGGGFALLRAPDDDEDDDDSDSSDESAIGQHAGTGDGLAGGSDGENENESQNIGSDGDDDNGSDETIEEAHTSHHGIAQSQNQEAGSSNNNQYAGFIAEEDQSEDQEESPSGSVAGDSEVGVVNGLALDDQMMVQHASASEDPLPSCDCPNGYAWSDLEDDRGLDPTKPQWKKWEKWVVRGCSQHDPRYDPSAT